MLGNKLEATGSMGSQEDGAVRQREALELYKISKTFGKLVANDDISLKVYQGELVALLGENGAGKTTLMNILFGHLLPDAGQVVVFGREMELGLPREIVLRQPFPGPGLAVRILGEVTPRRCEILRAADSIVVEEMKASGWYYKIWQSFAVLLPVKSVGVMGDERTYEYTIALRAVESQDGMTADWVKLPYDLLEKLSNRIINEVKGVNRVCFDISSKPPATIEWE